MGKAMISSRTRYTLPVAMLIGYILIFAVVEAYRGGLTSIDFVTGWVLCGVVFFQSFYQARKVRQIRLGTGATWLNLHIIMGCLSMLFFMFHLDWQWPSGIFDIFFTFIFVGTIATGICGLVLYRTLPRHFIQGQEELTFRLIPQLVRQLRNKAEEISLGSLDQARGTILADYYNRYIAPFLVRPHIRLKHLFGATESILNEMHSTERLISRVLNEEENERVKELIAIAEEKNRLDYQYTLKYIIKAWIFIHAPFAFTTMVFIAFHIVIVYAYTG